MVQLKKADVEQFYSVHKERPFFQELCNTMIAGPVVVQILSGDNAIAVYRKLMGATNPKDAEPGTLRNMFAVSLGENTVHGSDAAATAKYEIDCMVNAGILTSDSIFETV